MVDIKYLSKRKTKKSRIFKEKSHDKEYVDFEERKAQFVFDAQAIIEFEEIPDDLV